MKVLTFRNVLAVGLLLFGASYLWLTPMWLDQGDPKLGVLDPRGLLAVIAVLGFAIAAWGIFRSAGWWEPIAIGASIVGMISVIPYRIMAQTSTTVDKAAAFENIGIHLLGAAIVLAVLLVRPVEHWLVGRM